MEKIQTMVYESPVGRLVLGAYQGALCLCDWARDDRRLVRERVTRGVGNPAQVRLSKILENSRAFSKVFEKSDEACLDRAAAQLDEYFRGERREFDLELRMVGTPFQLEVWRALCDIPYGETMTYGGLARAIGRPSAVRAVAAAAQANAMSIVVPCHRLIGAGGALTGYAGGLDAKRALIELERPKIR